VADTTDGRALMLPALMLYDGLCGFCQWSVRWVVKRDWNDRFRFVPQQSALGQAVLARHGVDREATLADNSVYLVLDYDGDYDAEIGSSNERLLIRSDVTVKVLLLLGGFWGFLGKLLRAVPKPLRDGGYALVSRNRFRISKRYESCPLPSLAERAKFLA